MMFRGYIVHTYILRGYHCKANLSFSVSFSLFFQLEYSRQSLSSQRAYLRNWNRRSDSWGIYFYTVSLGFVALYRRQCSFYLTAYQVSLVFLYHCLFSAQVSSRSHDQRDLLGQSVCVHAVRQPAVPPRHLCCSLSVPLHVPLQRGLPGTPLRGDSRHVPQRGQQQPQPQLHVRHQHLCHGLSR